MKFRILIIMGLFISNTVFCQTSKELAQKADSLYHAKSYFEAGNLYYKSAELGWINSIKRVGYYNATCSYSLAKKNDLAFKSLKKCLKNGFSSKSQLEADADFEYMKSDSRWTIALSLIRGRNVKKPKSVKIVTSDIHLFYKTFDTALKDSTNATKIFKEKYFKKGSIGLQDFFVAKIKDEDQFTKYVFKNKIFLNSIRSTLLNTKKFKSEIIKNLKKYHKIYPNAVFSNVYFVIGRETSNGTASGNGLLIGSEVMSKTLEDSKSWSKEKINRILNFSQIPTTVAHEIVHFNQGGMKEEKTLLRYALVEGSSELIAELITGIGDCGGFPEFAGREKTIWKDFKIDMYEDKYKEWHNAQEPNRPRNGMYWAGYQICKSYYEQAKDKNQAIYDILNIKDYKAFYEKSNIDVYIEKTFK